MKKIIEKSTKIKMFIAAIGAVAAGVVNGFLGTGGGIILVFVLSLIATENDSVRDRFATVIAVIIPLSLVSAIAYGKTVVDFEAASKFILPGMLGGILGAYLLDKISVSWLKKLFALMVIWAGICFIR